MKKLPGIVVAALVAGAVFPVGAEESEAAKNEALSRLGAMNGLALHCKAVSQVRRIKKVMIENAPKLREYGEDFEEATNTGFLSAATGKAPCPGSNQLEQDVSKAIDRFVSVFTASK